MMWVPYSVPNAVAGPVGTQRTAPSPSPTEDIQLKQQKAVRDECQMSGAGIDTVEC